MSHKPKTFLQRSLALTLAALVPLQGLLPTAVHAQSVALADQPVFASNHVPGNLALALSVEFPTVSRVAHVGDYSNAKRFLGYFDPDKCYNYVRNTASVSSPGGSAIASDKGDMSYFQPVGRVADVNARNCNGRWSGNFLNWASLTAIDPFRWAMTGGRRVVDTPTETIIEKGWNAGHGYFPTRDQNERTEGRIPLSEVAAATPYAGSGAFSVEVNNRGYAIRINGRLPSSRTLRGKYYNVNPASGFTFPSSATPTHIVEQDIVDHEWGNGSPVPGIVTPDQFAAEYTGFFTAPTTGSYRFRVRADDGVRLWINTTAGQTAYSDSGFTDTNFRAGRWQDQGATDFTTENISLTAGQNFSVRIRYYENSSGATMRFSWQRPGSNDFTPFHTDSNAAQSADYTIRVKVCDPSEAAGGLESNCKAYSQGAKPEGLIQRYSDNIRFSAFGYMNHTGNNRDGGVLRARQKFVGPVKPELGQPRTEGKDNPEWDSTTGVMVRNPDSADASSTQSWARGQNNAHASLSIQDSGVMNYLNKFGQIYLGDYKGNDPVNELYYATLRYFGNLGNVDAWSDLGSADTTQRQRYLDGFPVIRNWDDPILYSCQRNFVLGIGDIYTHADKNLPGRTDGNSEPTLPAAVSSDTIFNANTSTARVGVFQGLTGLNNTTGNSSTAQMAGLALYANTKDIRPDVSNQAQTIGKQTVQTYWVDVLEAPFVANNKFYLAAKYGGMRVPANFNPDTWNEPIPLDWWSQSTNAAPDTLTQGSTTQARPRNYFTAGNPDMMVAGLTQAFESIVGDIRAFTTSFSLAAKQITSVDTASYATQYDSTNWTGEVTGSTINIDPISGEPVLAAVPSWSTNTRLSDQFASTGWDSNRRIVTTWQDDDTAGSQAIPFRYASLSPTQRRALDTSYVTGDDSANYLNWLRGDPSHEGTYRVRSETLSTGVRRQPLGDIVNSKITVVTKPSSDYSETANTGYTAFKRAYANRQTMLYVGANDGMLHALQGGLGTNAGTELFAYIPSVLFRPNPGDQSSTAGQGLLSQLGRPQYSHRNYVDATPKVFDIDFHNAGGAFATRVEADGTNTSDWRSVLIGGLGKGGRSYYAIDVTDPSAMTSEAAVAQRVLWEFPSRSKLPTAAGGSCTSNCIDMGYSYGDPVVVKTAKYGWVVIFSSGYNNQDGKGHLFIVNPTNGELLEDISTGSVNANGMARPTAYVRDYTDMTADSVYVGDLSGQLWRFDLRGARGSSTPYPAPTKIAQFTDARGVAQPVTSRPLVEIHPIKRKRFVMVGTGRLLHANDISNGQEQTFYSVVDGGIASFASVANDGQAYPVTRARLSNVVAPDQDTPASVNVDTSAGWRLDLGTTANVGWRVVGDQSDANNGAIGILSFPTVLPSGDACNPSGLSRAYVLNYANARTLLENDLPYMDFSAVITDLNFLNIRGRTRLIAGDNRGGIQSVPGNFGEPDPRRLSWREIPVGN